MPSKYWFKLYHEILDDPKMGQLPDRLYRRCIELFALAGDYDQGGLLPDIEDIAWRLRLPVEELQKDIADLQSPKLKIITQNDDGLIVTNFSKRQEPISGADRVKSFREQKRKEQYYGNEPSNEDVTHRYTDTDIDKEVEEEREKATPAPTSDIPYSKTETAQAYSAMQDHTSQDVAQLYRDVTGQMQPLSANIDKAFSDLELVLDYYDTVEDAVPPGKHIYGLWCQKRGKTGKTYSPLNIAWIEKWLENLARDAEKAKVAEQRERSHKTAVDASVNELAKNMRL